MAMPKQRRKGTTEASLQVLNIIEHVAVNNCLGSQAMEVTYTP